MKIDRKTFYAYVRNAPFGGRLTQQQVAGMEDLLDYIEKHRITNLDHCAYLFATFHHETGGLMLPVRETFADSAKQAIARLDNAWKAGRLGQVSKPYWREGWFGRGRVQVTHKENYEYVEKETGLAVTKNPDLLLDSKTDCRVSIPGTVQGWWTRGRHKLADYFNANVSDPVGARRIVNGTDKAKHIAENLFAPYKGAFKAAETSTPLPPDVTDEAAKPDGLEHWYNSTTIISTIGGIISTGGATAIAAINNPYALIFLIAAMAFGAWIIRERMRHSHEKGV